MNSKKYIIDIGILVLLGIYSNYYTYQMYNAVPVYKYLLKAYNAIHFKTAA